jgi:hypothetical protein
MRLNAQRSKLGSCERTHIQADANLKNARPWLEGTHPLTVFADTVTFALSVPVFGHGPSRPARASREIVAEHGDGDQRIANDPAHRPAVKSRPILTLRPPELSGRDAEHLTEVTRQVALVGKPHGKRNLR